SGTVAKLAGVSEGMHFHYAGYLIQRIRFQANDPLLPALKACGYHIEPDVYTKNTMVVEFPIRAAHADDPSFASAGTVSIAEQLATQSFLQTYWSDNAVSCTVTFQPEEADQIADLLSQYRHVIKSTSMLPYV
ncbi:ribonucleoside-triphosphate reductase, adenosylcobalamin-dependent, partial [Salmonella enterica subsp. enterica serovar Enteritidis]|nr:ribonucleoside-triphosphate reductase, adenosylcobalamin-dependent [Salmonella enterica subsp. enterica serovar Enteritidis]